MRLLLLSNSSTAGLGYLEHALPWFSDFLGDEVERVLFVPYAGVTVSWDDYAAKVRAAFESVGYGIDSIHNFDDARDAVSNAQAIAVGGGNTFRLLQKLYEEDLVGAIRSRAQDGLPFMGWSAGSNVAGPTIRTTNDMPIVEPPSFNALGLVPFQINPHYTNAHPPGHQGETRADRLNEFIELNRDATVLGLPEGTALRVEGNRMTRLGDKDIRVFKHGSPILDISDDDLSGFLS